MHSTKRKAGGGIDRDYYYDLSALFTSAAISKALEKGFGSAEAQAICNSGLLDTVGEAASLSAMYDALYDEFAINYRCEYVYKNSIASQLLVQRHELSSTAMLSEFSIDNCLADVVILNSTSSAYEIKTKLDSFERLKRQVSSYLKAFDLTYLVTHPSLMQKAVRELIDYNSVGLIALSDDGGLIVEREAVSNADNVDPGKIFESFRRSEYEWIIKEEFGYVPDVPNTRIYKECCALFCELDSRTAHGYMVEALKQRNNLQHLADHLRNVPSCLHALWLTGKLSPKLAKLFPAKLNTSIAEFVFAS